MNRLAKLLLTGLVTAGLINVNLCFAAEKSSSNGVVVIRGVVSSVDVKNRSISVSGTRVKLSPLGKVEFKPGQRVNLTVQKKNGRNELLGVKRSVEKVDFSEGALQR